MEVHGGGIKRPDGGEGVEKAVGRMEERAWRR